MDLIIGQLEDTENLHVINVSLTESGPFSTTFAHFHIDRRVADPLNK